MLLLNVGVFGLILLLTLLLAVGQKRVILLGWVCVGFSVSVFVAPLSIIVRKLIPVNVDINIAEICTTVDVTLTPFSYLLW